MEEPRKFSDNLQNEGKTGDEIRNELQPKYPLKEGDQWYEQAPAKIPSW